MNLGNLQSIDNKVKTTPRKTKQPDNDTMAVRCQRNHKNLLDFRGMLFLNSNGKGPSDGTVLRVGPEAYQPCPNLPGGQKQLEKDNLVAIQGVSLWI